MSSVVQIPLDKNPEVTDLVADLQPGDKVYACFSIRAKDEQTLSLRIEEMAATRDELPDGSERVEDDEGPVGDKEDGDGSGEEEREGAEESSSY